jgi:hypothetical protein
MHEEREDKKTLGVTPAGSVLLEELKATGWFNEETDVYKVAIGVAFANHLQKSPNEMTRVGTKWGAAQMDFDGRLRRLVETLSPEDKDRPYAACERRAAAGLEFLKRKLVDEKATLYEALQVDEPVPEDDSDANIL